MALGLVLHSHEGNKMSSMHVRGSNIRISDKKIRNGIRDDKEKSYTPM